MRWLLTFLCLGYFILLKGQTTAPGLLDWLQGEWKSAEGVRVRWEKKDIEILEGQFFTLEKSIESKGNILILEYTEQGAYLIYGEDPELSQALRFVSEEFLRESAKFTSIENLGPLEAIEIKRLGMDKMRIEFSSKEARFEKTWVLNRYKR
jgi:hypothetical protein